MHIVYALVISFVGYVDLHGNEFVQSQHVHDFPTLSQCNYAGQHPNSGILDYRGYVCLPKHGE